MQVLADILSVISYITSLTVCIRTYVHKHVRIVNLQKWNWDQKATRAQKYASK